MGQGLLGKTDNKDTDTDTDKGMSQTAWIRKEDRGTGQQRQAQCTFMEKYRHCQVGGEKDWAYVASVYHPDVESVRFGATLHTGALYVRVWIGMFQCW